MHQAWTMWLRTSKQDSCWFSFCSAILNLMYSSKWVPDCVCWYTLMRSLKGAIDGWHSIKPGQDPQANLLLLLNTSVSPMFSHFYSLYLLYIYPPIFSALSLTVPHWHLLRHNNISSSTPFHYLFHPLSSNRSSTSPIALPPFPSLSIPLSIFISTSSLHSLLLLSAGRPFSKRVHG